MLKKIIAVLLLASFVMGLTGCSVFTRPVSVKSNIRGVETVHNQNELVQGIYYIMHEKEDGSVEYYRPYIYRANYDTSKMEYASNSKSLFFGQDWQAVPTMYQGDRLVFRFNAPFEETFHFERFEYVGPTVGISNIDRLENSGHYYFSTSAEDDVTEANIAVNCDAHKLYELNSSVTVLNRLGGALLKSGNISRGGILLGLEEGKSYNAELYVGTRQYNYPLKADMIALTSMATYETHDYNYLDGKVAEIVIPSYFNSGYYNVGGCGIIRYVRGTGYSEATDFNVANIETDEEETPIEDEIEIKADINETKEETVLIDDNGETTVEVIWQEASEEVLNVYGDIEDPTARLITDTGAYTLTPIGDNAIAVTANLAAGRYRLQIDNLYGREYSINAYKGKGQQPEERNEKEAEEAPVPTESTAELPEALE